MACTLTLSGRDLGCKDSLGGVKEIYVAQWSEAMWDAVVSGEIADSAAALTMNGYGLTKGSASLTQTITSSIENGSVFFDQALTATFTGLSSADIAEISNLTKGRMAIVIQDRNDNYFVMGHLNGVEASGGTVQTGTAAGDLYGFTVEFSAQESTAAPFLVLGLTPNCTLVPSS